MEENLKVDKDYLEAFNLGYELAKELNLKTPMFKGLNLDNDSLNVLEIGMAEYGKEVSQEYTKKIIQSPDLDNNTQFRTKNKKGDNPEKGSDLSL